MIYIKGLKVVETAMLCDTIKYYQFRKTRGKKKRLHQKLFKNKRNWKTKIIKPGMLHDKEKNILFVSAEDYKKLNV